jgi:hypothetical protein
MSRLFVPFAVLLLALPAGAQQPVEPRVERPDATEQMDLKPAMAAAEAWLQLVDGGLYGQSWEEAAAAFKDKVVKLQWETGLQDQRNLSGRLASRKLASATYTRALPGAPPGEYVVVQYHSRFDNRPLATEIVTPMRQADGTWRVAGYFIR